MITWIDYLEEEVKKGLELSFFRQKRAYHLFWKEPVKRDASGIFVVRQGIGGKDSKDFSSFRDAYDWLFNGKPIK